MKSILRGIGILTLVGLVGIFLGGCDLENPGGTPSAAAEPAADPASVTISWVPPDSNSNGSALTNLAGYHIHYGTAATALSTEIDIPTTGLTDYVLQNLNGNTTYYFAVTSYNSQGIESTNSPVVTVTTGS